LRSWSSARSRGADLIGGRAVLAQSMTLGQFVQYVFFVGLVALPLINIASIGTQITEAFAGLDRIYELRRMTTEDAEDAQRAPLGRCARRRLRARDVAYKPGVPYSRTCRSRRVPARRRRWVGSSDRARAR